MKYSANSVWENKWQIRISCALSSAFLNGLEMIFGMEQMSLFDTGSSGWGEGSVSASDPLASRLRPESLEEFVG